MHCLVTAGPSYEKLDEVRRLTNFSTGRLGTQLAGYLTDLGYEVTLLLGDQSTYAGERRAARTHTFATTQDLANQLAQLAGPRWGGVFHVAAVSDFRFGRVFHEEPDGTRIERVEGKLPTREGPLLAELVPTPKLIRQLRDWFPAARIVGWKYEVDGDRDAVLGRARRQIEECRTDACVVNGTAFGQGFGLVRLGEPWHPLRDARELYPALAELLR